MAIVLLVEILVHSKAGILGIGPAQAAPVQPRPKSDIQATGPSGGAAPAMAALLVGSLLNQRGGVRMIGVRGALSNHTPSCLVEVSTFDLSPLKLIP